MPRGEPTRSVPVRFTEAERAALEIAARDHGESLTGYVRRKALAGTSASRSRAVPPMTRESVMRATQATATRIAASMPVRERPAHHPTCKCPVCRPPKPAK